MTQQSAAQYGANPVTQNLATRGYRQPDDPRMLIPDQLAALTRERDQARAEAAALTRELVMARESVAWFEQEHERMEAELRVTKAQHTEALIDQQQASACNNDRLTELDRLRDQRDELLAELSGRYFAARNFDPVLAADQQHAVVCKTRCSHDEPEPAGRYGLIRDQAQLPGVDHAQGPDATALFTEVTEAEYPGAANEPAVIRQAMSLMDNLDPDLCPFLDPAAPPCSTGHVMPLRALTHAKQAVGLLW